MVSRRNFFSIIIMMVALLFMFQFSQVIKENGNNYNFNEFAVEDPVSGKYRWSSDNDSMEQFGERSHVLFIGNEEDGLGDMILSWCTYSKRLLKVLGNTDNYDFDDDTSWEMILIDSESIDFGKETDRLLRLADTGTPIVFCNLPDASLIKKDKRLAQLLGISEIRQGSVEVLGLHMFSGFLLGGEALYRIERPEDLELCDFDLQVPWYVTGKGTKTYMVGIMDEDEVKREEFPAIIWRNAYKDTFVFAVNGEYMSGLTGMGLLDAMLYELKPYALYPVVNAQNAVVVDFPYLAPENAAEMEELYSRSPQAALRDVFWSGLVSLAVSNKLRPSCCISTKYDYTDPAAASGEELPFYLQQMKEINAEACRSLNFKEGVTLEEKAEADGAFFASTNSTYKYSAVYLESMPEDLDVLLREENGLEDVRTVVCAKRGELPLISYVKDSVTLQGATNTAGEYTYSKDLQLRSLVTALGYSNLLIEMQNLRWPSSRDDRWENYSDEVFSNIGTYWTRYDAFAYTTLSEADARVRAFLNLDYREKGDENGITLFVSEGNQDAWFVLRLHNQRIAGIENGEYEELEAGAYLIHTLSRQVEIHLEKARDVLEYTGAFAS